jgi:hypothetical protein
LNEVENRSLIKRLNFQVFSKSEAYCYVEPDGKLGKAVFRMFLVSADGGLFDLQAAPSFVFISILKVSTTSSISDKIGK